MSLRAALLSSWDQPTSRPVQPVMDPGQQNRLSTLVPSQTAAIVLEEQKASAHQG